jgi:hypothetical protein
LLRRLAALAFPLFPQKHVLTFVNSTSLEICCGLLLRPRDIVARDSRTHFANANAARERLWVTGGLVIDATDEPTVRLENQVGHRRVLILRDILVRHVGCEMGEAFPSNRSKEW